MAMGFLFGGARVGAATTSTLTSLAEAVNRARESVSAPVLQTSGHHILGLSVWSCVGAAALILAGLLLRRVVITVLDRYRHLEKPAFFRLDDRIVATATHPIGMAVVIASVLVAVKVLQLSPGPDRFLTNLTVSAFIIVVAWLLFNLTDTLVRYLERFVQGAQARLDVQLLPILRKSLKIFVVILAALQVIDQMGGDVKGLLAGLGLGGLAFALAARESIANVFGSIVILADRPFRVGDWISAAGVGIEGAVEEVGFRSTRIRTFSQSVVTVPNSVVANWAIDNKSTIPKRRVKETLSLSFDTTPQQLESAMEEIREVLAKHPMVDMQAEVLVHFMAFGENALQVMVCYFTKTNVWADYLKIIEQVNLAILRLLDAKGIKLTTPANALLGQLARVEKK